MNNAETTIDNVTVTSIEVTGSEPFTLTNSIVKGTNDEITISTTGKITLQDNIFEGGE